MKRVVVTGCSGFIGSHMAEKLISEGYFVTGIDNLSTGRIQFLKNLKNKKKFKFIKTDLYHSNINKYFKNHNAVFHFAANADVKDGLKHPDKDLKQNTIVTFKVLEAMRKNKIKNIFFSSTGSIYGEPNKFPTPENDKFPIQTSLYGSSKLACEGLMQAYSEGYKINSFIFRFVSIFGPRYTHGHLYDFYKQLKKNPKKLIVLGNGYQSKSYLNVSDCVSAIFKIYKKKMKGTYVYNLGLNKLITVRESIKILTKYLNLKPVVKFGKAKRGWIGDSPKILLDIKKIKKTGWTPKKKIKESIHETVEYFKKNDWVFK
jgi:UDP-glucose 4-epimerase